MGDSKKPVESSQLPNVVMIGDSLTEWSFDVTPATGLGQVMEQKALGIAKVVNAGHAGFTTTEILPVVSKLCSTVITKENPPILITLWLGTNDSVVNHFRSVSLAQYTSQMRAIILTLLSRNAPRILVITPPPINVPPMTKKVADTLTESEILKSMGVQAANSKMTFAAAVVRLVRQMQEENDGKLRDRLEVANVWQSMTNKALSQGGQLVIPSTEELTGDTLTKYNCPGTGLPGTTKFPDRWFADPIHLGAKGYEVICEEVFEVLEKWPNLFKSEKS